MLIIGGSIMTGKKRVSHRHAALITAISYENPLLYSVTVGLGYSRPKSPLFNFCKVVSLYVRGISSDTLWRLPP